MSIFLFIKSGLLEVRLDLRICFFLLIRHFHIEQRLALLPRGLGVVNDLFLAPGQIVLLQLLLIKVGMFVFGLYHNLKLKND